MMCIVNSINWGGENVVQAGAIIEDFLEEEVGVLQLGNGDQCKTKRVK